MKKKCSRCRRTKPVSEFPRNASAKGGYGHYCRKCAAAANKRTREKYRKINTEAKGA